MDIKSKNILVIIALISISILTGAVLAPSFLNWGIERSLPVFGIDEMDKPLEYNQYLISGEYLTSNQQFIYVLIENRTWIMIDKINQSSNRDYKICEHKENFDEFPGYPTQHGDKVKYAVFAEDFPDNWNKFILRRELC